MWYEVFTPHGVFRIIQQLTYGELLIAMLLVVLIVLVGIKLLLDVAYREGWL